MEYVLARQHDKFIKALWALYCFFSTVFPTQFNTTSERSGQNSPRTHRNQGLTTSHWPPFLVHRIVVTQIHRDDLPVLYQQLKRDAV